MVMKIKEQFRKLLHLDDTPHRIAIAFALGVYIAFSPLVGLHTAMVFLFAWLFRLNTIALLLGSLLNNPWTFGPIFGGCLWLGVKLYGISYDAAPIDWRHLTVMNLIPQLKPYLIPFVLGTTLIGIIASVIAYLFANYLITQYRHVRTAKQPL
jgi:uncharacterized protein